MLKKHRKGAATTEYILILAVVLGFALLFFWQTLAGSIGEKLYEMGIDIPALRNRRVPKKSNAENSAPDPQNPAGPMSGSPGAHGTPEYHTFPGGTGAPHSSTGPFKNR